MIVPISLESVPPKSSQEFVVIPHHDLWLTFVKNVHDIPEALDIDEFKAALSKTLAIYWHACGRLIQETSNGGSSDWKIRLTSSTIPLEIAQLENPPIFTDSVIQDELKPYLPRTEACVVNADSPLLAFQLHISARRTVIGVAWHHTLGDAATLLRFMTTLSGFYERHDPSSESLPSFRKHRFPKPSSMDIPKWLPHMSHLACTYPATEIHAKYAEGNEPIKPIRAIVRRSDAKALRERVQAMQDSDSKLRLSIQDTLTACVVAAINNLSANTIRRVTNAAGYRQVHAEWNEPNVAGNSIYIVSSKDFDSKFSQNLDYLSKMIRESLLEARKPEFVAGYMSVAGHRMALAAEKNEQFFFGSDHNTLSVNSNLILNWQSANFGFHNARFYTSGITRFYLRVFPANPTSGIREGNAIDLTFGVPASMRSGVIEQLGPEFLIVQ